MAISAPTVPIDEFGEQHTSTSVRPGGTASLVAMRLLGDDTSFVSFCLFWSFEVNSRAESLKFEGGEAHGFDFGFGCAFGFALAALYLFIAASKILFASSLRLLISSVERCGQLQSPSHCPLENLIQ